MEGFPMEGFPMEGFPMEGGNQGGDATSLRTTDAESA